MSSTRQTLMRWTLAFPSRAPAAALRANTSRGGLSTIPTPSRAASTTAPTHAPKGFGLIRGASSSRWDDEHNGRFESRYRRPRDGSGGSRYRDDRDDSFEPSSSSSSTSTSRGPFWGEDHLSRDHGLQLQLSRREAGGMGSFRRRGDERSGGFGGSGRSGRSGFGLSKSDTRRAVEGESSSYGSYGSRRNEREPSRAYGDARRSRTIGGEPEPEYDKKQSRSADRWSRDGSSHSSRRRDDGSPDFGSRDGPPRDRGEGGSISREDSGSGVGVGAGPRGSAAREDQDAGAGADADARLRPRSNAEGKTDGDGHGDGNGDGDGAVMIRPRRPWKRRSGEAQLARRITAANKAARMGEFVEVGEGGLQSYTSPTDPSRVASAVDGKDRYAGNRNPRENDLDQRNTDGPSKSHSMSQSQSQSQIRPRSHFQSRPCRHRRHEEQNSVLSFLPSPRTRTLTGRLSDEDLAMTYLNEADRGSDQATSTDLTKIPRKSKLTKLERWYSRKAEVYWEKRGNVANRRRMERAMGAEEMPERLKSSGATRGAPRVEQEHLTEELNDYSSSAVNPLSATLTPTGKRPWEPTKKLTLPAMAGLRALHSADPVRFSRQVLSRRFGISYEAVSRILRSRFAENAPESGSPDQAQDQHQQHAARSGAGDDEGPEPSLKGTKWDTTPATGEGISPVPAIRRAFDVRQTAMEMAEMAEMARARAEAKATVSSDRYK